MKSLAATFLICALTLIDFSTPANAQQSRAERAQFMRHDQAQPARRVQRVHNVQRTKTRQVRSVRAAESRSTRRIRTRVASRARAGAGADIYLRSDDHVPQAAMAAPAVNQPVFERRDDYASQGAAAVASASAAYGATYGSHALVSEARQWLGTNPTNRRTLWCGAFMNFVLERSGYRRGKSDLARSFASYGRRLPGPQVGAIAVMARGGGGHVGVVSGFDGKGNPIIISGNHANSVREVVYPRGRIYAYVMPSQ
jgi:uncharacterized protein (TIGR02594 family)